MCEDKIKKQTDKLNQIYKDQADGEIAIITRPDGKKQIVLDVGKNNIIMSQELAIRVAKDLLPD